jgi:arginase
VEIRSHFDQLGITRFWIHLDADVVDATEMPAVDCPERDGPNLHYVGELIRVLVEDNRALGLNLTIYDPDLDPKGSCAAALANLLVEALTRSSPTV